MKSVVLAAAAIIGLGSLTAITVAQHCEMGGASAPATQPAAARPTTAPVALNTKCLVSGDDVDPAIRTITYEGKTVGFCCNDCVAKFKRNPDKYMKNLKKAPSTMP